MTLEDCYSLGRRLSAQGWESLEQICDAHRAYEPLGEAEKFFEWEDTAGDIFCMAGLAGQPRPVQVIGWRYGDAPDGGRSYDYRDQRMLAGTSMVQIEGGKPTLSFAVIEASDRPKRYYRGYLYSETGPDSEPLLVNPEKVDGRRFSAKFAGAAPRQKGD